MSNPLDYEFRLRYRAAVPKRIQDKFSKLGFSRQRKWQLRQNERGLCMYCNRKLFRAAKCRKHWDDERTRYRLGADAMKRISETHES